jgi:hypothetical protein
MRNGGDGGLSLFTFELSTPVSTIPDLIEVIGIADVTLPIASASGTWSITAIPEPASYLLVLTATAVLWLIKISRRVRSN